MILANDHMGTRIEAAPDQRGWCPVCEQELVAKCGELRIWHWAHHGNDCDPWSEPESEWHRDWKARAETQQTEVTIGNHRADIRTRSGWVVELQHSPIRPEEMHEREEFYGRMVWLFDLRAVADHIDLRPRRDYWTFRWRWPRGTIAQARRPVLLDLGDQRLFRLRKFDPIPPAGGWGFFVPVAEFVEWLRR